MKRAEGIFLLSSLCLQNARKLQLLCYGTLVLVKYDLFVWRHSSDMNTFHKHNEAYLLFDCKELFGGREGQLLNRVFLDHHVCASLVSNLQIAAT